MLSYKSLLKRKNETSGISYVLKKLHTSWSEIVSNFKNK